MRTNFLFVVEKSSSVGLDEVEDKRSSIVDILQAGVQSLIESISRSGSKRSSSEVSPKEIESFEADSERSLPNEETSSKKTLIRSRSASQRESIYAAPSESRKSSYIRSRLASKSSIIESTNEDLPRRRSTATNMSEDTIAHITDIEEDISHVSELETKSLYIFPDNGKSQFLILIVNIKTVM